MRTAMVSALAGSASARSADAIVEGEVMHTRSRPATNAFRYPAFCLRVPLSRLASMAQSGIALNARGLVSFRERDHGPRDGSSCSTPSRACSAMFSIP